MMCRAPHPRVQRVAPRATVVNNQGVDAGPVLASCIQQSAAAGATQIELPAGSYYHGGCTAQPLVVSTGDSVAVSGNSYGPFANLLGGCGPLSLPPLVIHRPNIDYPVALAYQQILGRDVDQGGGEAFTNLLHTSGLAAVRSSLAGSTEAHNAIDAAYLRVLGRHADAGGLSSNVSALASGAITMPQLLVNLELSAEALSNPYRWY